MSQTTRRQYSWSAETTPHQIEAFISAASIEVFDRQVEITVMFDDIPDPHLSKPRKFISRDPAVVAFHQRVFAAIRKRNAAAEAQVADQEGRAA